MAIPGAMVRHSWFLIGVVPTAASVEAGCVWLLKASVILMVAVDGS